MEPLIIEERAARQRQSDRRVNAKLEAARLAASRASSAVSAAEAAVEAAQLKLQQARAKAEEAEKKVRNGEASIHAESQQHTGPGAHEELIRRTRALLNVIESGRLAPGRDLPEELVQCMTAAHEVMEAMAPTPAARIDEPLEPEQL